MSTSAITSATSSSTERVNPELIAGYDPARDAGDCYFDEAAAARIVHFFHTYLRHVKGKHAREPFLLEPWERAWLTNLYGWKRPDGTRRYRKTLLFVARKNGKTSLAAGPVLYALIADGESGAEIYSTAGEREQAALIYGQAAGMVRMDETLTDRIQIYRTTKTLTARASENFYRALSSDSDTKHGANTHLVVHDEVHVHKNRNLIDVMDSSVGSRAQPLIFYTTTAGFDKKTICGEVYEYAKGVLAGTIRDPEFLPVVFETDASDDWSSEEVWRKANPNLGVSTSLEFLRSEFRKAQKLPAYENTFRRLYLNQWTESDIRWLSWDTWLKCKAQYDEASLYGQECYGGIDLSSTTDITAFVLWFPRAKRCVTWFWVPAERMQPRADRDHVPYPLWAKQGCLYPTPGATVDYAYIRKTVNEAAKKFKFKEIAIDRWNATQIALELQGDGFTMAAFGQGFASMNAPSKEFERLIVGGELTHNGNPVMDWMASNVMKEEDAAGNIKPSKSKSTERIDGIVALIMAIGQSMVAEKPAVSAYATRQERVF